MDKVYTIIPEECYVHGIWNGIHELVDKEEYVYITLDFSKAREQIKKGESYYHKVVVSHCGNPLFTTSGFNCKVKIPYVYGQFSLETTCIVDVSFSKYNE